MKNTYANKPNTLQGFTSLYPYTKPSIKYSSKQQAFTIVELLIVIVVIAILAAISIAVYTNIQQRAKNTAITSQEAQARRKLETYKIQNNSYPADQDAFDAFMGQSPGSSPYTTYVPSPTFDTYFISTRGTNLSLDCPTGFIEVPGSGAYGTNSFCAMKYEAKNVNDIPTSQASGTPWVSINQTNAITKARATCSGCHLLTEAEWMTIAVNTLSVAENWSGGSVGSGTFPRGNSNGGSALDASSDLAGINKRSLKLTNGEEIWDIAGNVWEWTQGTITGGQPGLVGQSSYVWNDYNNSNLQWNGLSSESQPSGTLYARSYGVGGVYSNPSEAGLRAFIRGGYWDDGSNAGVLALNLSSSPSSTNTNIGFRVAR